MRSDITSIEHLEIRIAREGDGYRVWVDGPDGNVFRAYRVKELTLSGLRLALESMSQSYE